MRKIRRRKLNATGYFIQICMILLYLYLFYGLLKPLIAEFLEVCPREWFPDTRPIDELFLSGWI